MRILLGMLLCVLLITSSWATPYRELKRGNAAADSGDADGAQYHYLRALEQGGDTNLVEYNIGNLLYQREDFEKAQQAFMASLDTMQDRKAQSEALYNLANSYFKAEQFEPAVKAYIESLKRNPEDVEAKQNLELALRMMQQQQQQQQNDENKDEQNQEQQDQKQKQDQEKQDEQKQQEEQQQQQQQQEQQQQEEEQQQQQMKPEEMTKEEAEQLLNALQQDEQDALEKVKKAQVQGRKKRERDW